MSINCNACALTLPAESHTFTTTKYGAESPAPISLRRGAVNSARTTGLETP
ncbi:hypothetical protein COSO111634_23415 [Corallococcus soli]